MIDKVVFERCVQCQNCQLVCPVNAISMNRTEKMFSYPEIDEKKCIKCNKCEKVCPVLNPLKQRKNIISYAVKHKDKNIKMESSSGGLFTALAQTVIDEKGYVFGASFRDDFKVQHICVKNIEELSLLRGSKYVKSDLKDTFIKIEKLLCLGNKVLFSGTPCQCAALKAYLKEKRYNGQIYIIDFICQGILSDKLFEEYLEFLENKEKSEILSFEFRDKTYGWLESGPKVNYCNGKSKKWPLYEDLYMQGYFQSICMRESCYRCEYKNFYSGSDITMGDFWGADILEKEFFDPLGVSLCCIQSNNGMNLVNKAEKYLEIKQVPLKTLIKYNQGLIYPFKKGEKSNQYFEMVKEKKNIVALKKITDVSMLEKVKRIYRRIRRELYRK